MKKKTFFESCIRHIKMEGGETLVKKSIYCNNKEIFSQ